ncbi:Hha/YmoA family nucleoid-associated regulatory protein [Morganella morganii]|uniref:Hemolysin expression modulating protein n=1 Tax=Morganella morganii TaxID=582 RepID=A0A6B7PVK9_MORMO|nr:Hha/YmoA family nucleoid-associated regulatory protein [Morganella morganii]HBT7313289.1 hemolysin activation protein [Klebsiella pneumoniae]EGT3611255.1 hemolysin activation protein [Morganella morganii]EKW8501132.1 hemolysin activation protein [Morganella morganii]ELB1544630.1 hemolysin activation protein [Morganella morganii]MBS9572198.1 hemolysin activation protein [Morganella morganii subsp. morganii]
MKSKLEWLQQLRRCSCDDTLTKVSERILSKLTGDERDRFLMAYDHRQAEIVMNKLYDRIPVSVWKFVK